MSDKKLKYYEDGVIQDSRIEGVTIGAILNNTNIINEYGELINPDHDFASDVYRLYYKLLVNTYMNHAKINEISINLELYKLDTESQTLYKEIGGYDFYKRLSQIGKSASDDFSKTYSRLKAFNLLRNLHEKGYNVLKHLDILADKSADDIIKIYESNLIKASSFIKGINDSIVLGEDALEVYESYKTNPDFGINIPFPLLNHLVRGWRKGKVYADAMHSGHGKSRKAIYIAVYTSIINQTPVLIGVNEQDKEEIMLMLLTCVANNIFSKKYGEIKINETEIALGQCTGAKDEMMKEAATYIQENSNIHFLELNFWDLDTLKIILKKHKLRGINYCVIDTFKPMRGMGFQDNMSDWMRFSYTVEKLKEIIGSEKKGGLDMGLWLTMQMTDDSIEKKSTNSTALASSKQIKHHLDCLTFSRKLDYKDKEKMKVKINDEGNPFHNNIQQLNRDKDHYLTVVDKNRGGLDSKHIIYEVSKGEMTFKELGEAVYVSQEPKPIEKVGD